MVIKKINIDKALIFFLFSHLIIWTLVPSISNINLPLDTIEALAWGTNIDWGYNKHPPLNKNQATINYVIAVSPRQCRGRYFHHLVQK